MGLFDRLASIASTLTPNPQHIASTAVDYGRRARQMVEQTAGQVRDHFTHGNGHVLDNVLRNAGNDVVRAGQASFGSLGREVAGNIVDGGTAVVQDLASVTPGLSRRGGDRHIPNHNTLLERGLGSFAETVMSPFIRQHPRPTPQQLEAMRANSVAISLRPEDAEAVAAHNARLAANRNNQAL